MHSPPSDASPVPAAVGPAAEAYLDALRAIAANLVIGSHIVLIHYHGQVGYWGGSLAVALFFLLSGFLITQSMLNRVGRPTGRFAVFLADRVARIMTPYVPALLLIALANVFLLTTKWGAPEVNTGLRPLLGNLLMLQDHAFFQLLENLHREIPWRIRPYNTAEPFWTVAIEMWLYVAAGLFFYVVLQRERVRAAVVWPLALLALPVVVWNAAAGGGKSLTLIWIVGAVAGWMLARWRAAGRSATARWPLWVVAFGALALAGRVRKAGGFDPYDLQTAVLVALVVFGGLAWLMTATTVRPAVAAACRFFASYSYSLYLIHNTVLVLVWEHTREAPRWVSIGLGVLAAHVVAYGLYLAFERHYRQVAAWLRPRFERIAGGSAPPRGAAPAAGVAGRG